MICLDKVIHRLYACNIHFGDFQVSTQLTHPTYLTHFIFFECSFYLTDGKINHY
ncbi:hypothetical protein Hanom_Chr10g00965521 [Helianthus anomalus]